MPGMSPIRWLSSPAHHRLVLWIAALATVVLLPGLLKLETDNSPEIFFVEGSPSLAVYDDFRQRFGSDQAVRLVFREDEGPAEALWLPETLAWLAELEAEVAGLPGIHQVAGVAARRGWAGPARDKTAPDPEAARRAVLADPLDRGLGLVGREGDVLSVLVIFDDDAAVDQETLLDDLETLATSAPAGVTAEVVGLPVLNRTLDQSSREIGERFFPLLVLFAVVLLLVAFRDVVGVLMPLGFVAFCVLATLGIMGWSGERLNLVLAVLPPLLFVIALATALHLLLRFRDLYEAQVARGRPEPSTGCPKELDLMACDETYHEKGWSVLWTGVTTLVGFASLALGPVAPVRLLGLWAALALTLLTLFAFTLYPALLVTWGSHGNRAADALEARAQGLGRRWGQWANDHRRLVLAATLVLAGVAGLGLPRLEVESNALRFLAEDHPVRSAIEALERDGIGLATTELLITGPEGYFAPAARLGELAQLGATLEDLPDVLGAVSAGEVLRSAVAPAPPTDLALALLRSDPRGQRVLGTFLSDDLAIARISLSVPVGDVEQFRRLEEGISATTRTTFPEAKFLLTGQYTLLVEGQRHLLATLSRSLGFTLLAVALILRFLLPGWRLTLLALLPNIAPVLGVLGFMGWLGIPLDVATVMVSSVALGLAVDDTLHTLGHFRHLGPELGAPEGVVRTLEITAPAYLVTGVVLATGFGICALSSFAPTARFGLLAAIAIVLAVLGDLFLLPALLGLTPRSTLERWVKK